MKAGETMTNNIKLGTLIKCCSTNHFKLHDIQYDICEFYTRNQILNNKQLLKMKVIQFSSIAEDMINVEVVE